MVAAKQLHVGDFVRLIVNIPELCLHRGDVGIVRSIWFSPATAYEVDFVGALGGTNRTLLLAEQIQVVDEPLNATCTQNAT